MPGPRPPLALCAFPVSALTAPPFLGENCHVATGERETGETTVDAADGDMGGVPDTWSGRNRIPSPRLQSDAAIQVVRQRSRVRGAHDSAYGVAIRGASVNSDHSVTIAWELESPNVFNQWLAVDGSVVRSGSDRARIFTTRPLSVGSHTITIEVRELFETYSRSGSSCVESGGHWVCARNWRNSMIVSVPYEMDCVVPRVVGLRLAVAKARITKTACSIGAVRRLHSKQPAGTILGQRPTATGRQLPNDTAIRLVVSIGV